MSDMNDPRRLERLDRLDAYINEGRLIREQWTGHDMQGREVACVLAALSPEAGEAEHAGACPAWLMPDWLAYMTPWMHDYASPEAWPGLVRRYAALARRWHVLSPHAWLRLDYGLRRLVLEEVLPYAGLGCASEVVKLALGLVCRAEAGEDVSGPEWAGASAKARTLARDAMDEVRTARRTLAEGQTGREVDAARAALRAALARREAVNTVCMAMSMDPETSATAPVMASWAAAEAVAVTAVESDRAVMADRITRRVLDAIEAACAAAEAAASGGCPAA